MKLTRSAFPDLLPLLIAIEAQKRSPDYRSAELESLRTMKRLENAK